MSGIKFDIKTGQIFIRNYDQGIIETMGGFVDCSPNGDKKNYYINITGLSSPKVPVIFSNPFQQMEKKILPCFMIQRSDMRPAMGRWHSVGEKQYRIGVGDIATVNISSNRSVSGYEDYETLVQAMPFDIEYTINCLSRYEHEAIFMIKKVLSVYKPYSRIIVKDSLNEIRTYTVFNESSVQDISEIVDIHDRTKAYSVTVRVEGELDLSDPETNMSVLHFKRNFNIIK